MGMKISRSHTIGLIVPALAAISPMLWSKVRQRALAAIPTPLYALVAGAVVAAVCWVVFRYGGVLRERQALARAVLLGVLVAETMVFHLSFNIPSVTSITLFLFLYFYSTENTSH